MCMYVGLPTWNIVQLILATFDIFDTEPRTWQLDFDEFCHWLETGERLLNCFGVSEAPKTVASLATGLPKGTHRFKSYRLRAIVVRAIVRFKIYRFKSYRFKTYWCPYTLS